MKKFSQLNESKNNEVEDILNELRDEGLTCSHEIYYMIDINHRMANGNINTHKVTVSKELAKINGDHIIKTKVEVAPPSGQIYDIAYNSLDMYPAQTDIKLVTMIGNTLERLSNIAGNFEYRLAPGIGFESLHQVNVNDERSTKWPELWEHITDVNKLKKDFEGSILQLGNRGRTNRAYSLTRIKDNNIDNVIEKFYKFIKPFVGYPISVRRWKNGKYETYNYDGLNFGIVYQVNSLGDYQLSFRFENLNMFLPNIFGFNERQEDIKI